MAWGLGCFAAITALSQHGVKVDRAAVGPGVEHPIFFKRTQGFQNSNHRLGWFEASGVDLKDLRFHGLENAGIGESPR